MTRELNNEAFDAMTRSERAVAVAQDVINLLTLAENPLIADHKGYISSVYEVPDGADELQPLIPEILKAGCTVCARGAVMIAKARLFDRVPTAGIVLDGCLNVDSVDTTRALDDVFHRDQLQRMEHAYEHWYRSDIGYGCAVFGLQFNDPKDRLIAIMQNVIDNDGDFVVPDATVAEHDIAYDNYMESNE